MCRALSMSAEDFATALRAVGEPMRGKPVRGMSVGQMLDGLFAITRDFDMQTQPHLLLLQKTMVMVEGVATALDPDDQHVGHRRAVRRGVDARPNWGQRRRWPTGCIGSAKSRWAFPHCCAASRTISPPGEALPKRRRCRISH